MRTGGITRSSDASPTACVRRFFRVQLRGPSRGTFIARHEIESMEQVQHMAHAEDDDLAGTSHLRIVHPQHPLTAAVIGECLTRRSHSLAWASSLPNNPHSRRFAAATRFPVGL